MCAGSCAAYTVPAHPRQKGVWVGEWPTHQATPLCLGCVASCATAQEVAQLPGEAVRPVHSWHMLCAACAQHTHYKILLKVLWNPWHEVSNSKIKEFNQDIEQKNKEKSRDTPLYTRKKIELPEISTESILVSMDWTTRPNWVHFTTYTIYARAENKRLCINRVFILLLLRWLLYLFSNPHCHRGSGENNLHLPLWHLCIQSYAFWVMQCSSYLSDIHNSNFLGHGRGFHGSIHSWFLYFWWYFQVVP